MRAPIVAGVGGGVGTTTVAVGLRALDAGRVAGLPPRHRPDILVCRATFDSVQRAAAVLNEVDHEPPPVLAVTLTGMRAPRGPLRARLELLEADTAAVVLLPHVRRWGVLVNPLGEVARLLVEPAAQLPRPLRAYATALRDLAAAVAGSGRLGHRPDDRHPRRTGADERAVRRHGLGAPAPEPARPSPNGGFRPGGSHASRGAGTPGPLSSSPIEPTPRHTEVQRRQGVRIVTPHGVRPANARRPDRIGVPAAPAADAVPVTASGAGERRSGRQGAGDPAERVEQVG